jgi:RNA polymerase sigma factor (sigma-70 family)
LDQAPVDTGDSRTALARVIRDEWPRVVASLMRTTGSLQLAEDAVQDATVRALDAWSRDGIPPEPRAWLIVTARRRAVDIIRRESNREDKETQAVDLLDPYSAPLPDGTELRDDLLRLLFICCHPSLATDAQTALALRTLCGLTTAEVASALVVSEQTMAKRLVRAKQKIAQANIPFRTPAQEEFPERLRGVLTTIYLLFNEGYHATTGESPLRRQLTAEAIRLVGLLRELLPDQVGALGLEALMRLIDARSPARLDERGDPVLLSKQNRSVWDRSEIAAGLSLLGIALRLCRDEPDAYVVQAAIAACHDLAPTWDETNWAAIVSWYDVLLAISDTPVVRLNRAVALGELHGPQRALEEIELITELPDYLPLEATRAEFLARAGRAGEARTCFEKALALPGNEAAKRELSRRMKTIFDD